MTKVRRAFLPMFATATLAATGLPPKTSPSLRAEVRLCTLKAAPTLALIRVEQDTTLPFAPTGAEAMSMSGVRAGPADSMLATPSTPMPAARVRVLQLDSSTRVIFAAHGITDSQPLAFIRAAPYRSDCRTIRWTDTVPFVTRGEVGYVRATLAPCDRWIDGVPVLVIPDAWNYRYPRHRALAFGVAPDAPLAPAEAIFSLDSVLEMPRPVNMTARIQVAPLGEKSSTHWPAVDVRLVQSIRSISV